MAIVSSFLFPLQAQQTQAVISDNLPTRLLSSNNGKSSQILLPDWHQISFDSLPAIQQNGSVKVENKTRTWQAGQTPDQYLSLGDITEALRYAIADIPNIESVQLGQFQGWSDFQR